MILFVSLLFLTGCGSNDTEEPAEESTAPSEGTEEDAEDASVEDKEGTGSDAEPETDTEGTDSGEDTSGEESTEETEDTTGEDRAREDTDRDDEAESDTEGSDTETDSENSTEEDDSSDSSSSDDAAAASTTEAADTRDIDVTPTEEMVTGLDGTEITSMFELNSGIGEELSNASESNAAVEDVLMPKEEVPTYYAETFMLINVFTGGSDTPADNDMAGLAAEIDERDGFEVYAGQFDPATSSVVPYAYANAESLFVNEGGMWNDYTGQAPADEIYYGSYSNLYDAFMESSDVINVSEDDENYYLHNIGSETVLHDTFGTLFSVEFTNADTSQQKNGVVGVVDKESQELSHVAYISTAPGMVEGEMLHIEIASGLGNYGEYDDSGVTIPEGIYE